MLTACSILHVSQLASYLGPPLVLLVEDHGAVQIMCVVNLGQHRCVHRDAFFFTIMSLQSADGQSNSQLSSEIDRQNSIVIHMENKAIYNHTLTSAYL